MRRILCVAVLIGIIGAVGCAKRQHKEWAALGGTGNTVKLGYEYTGEPPTTNDAQATDVAKKFCNSWGFAYVEPFGNAVEDCIQQQIGFFGRIVCQKMRVTKEYNCVGRYDDVPQPTVSVNKLKK